MKVLPSSIRERKRYIAFEILSEQDIDRQGLLKEIWSSAYSLFGDVGTSKLGLWLIKFDGKKGIVRCHRDRTEEVRALLAAIDVIYACPVGVVVLRTSGTVKGVKRALTHNNQKPPLD
ncbi:MAG: Rpp14/Pop5 family protein [Halobacteriota archaeon]|nr:Rpp14/Pop5 family protein [Halobacteriota archaeon]